MDPVKQMLTPKIEVTSPQSPTPSDKSVSLQAPRSSPSCSLLEVYKKMAEFSQEEVQGIVKETTESVLSTSAYQHSQVSQWTSSIVEQTLAQLTKLNKPFKYIVTCCIMQKNGAGLHMASTCYWDNTTDGSCTVRWENRTMYSIVSVFACAI